MSARRLSSLPAVGPAPPDDDTPQNLRRTAILWHAAEMPRTLRARCLHHTPFGRIDSMPLAAGHRSSDMPPECCLGVDPGLNRTGYAVLSRPAGAGANGVVLREGGVVRSTSSLSLAERVHEIGAGLREVLEEFQPQELAIEQVFSLSRNPKTALLMAHARGAILYAAADHGIPVTHYTPRQIKKLLTGSGAASKEQVQRAVTRELQLDRILEPNDVSDACAIALCHLHSRRVVTASE